MNNTRTNRPSPDPFEMVGVDRCHYYGFDSDHLLFRWNFETNQYQRVLAVHESEHGFYRCTVRVEREITDEVMIPGRDPLYVVKPEDLTVTSRNNRINRVRTIQRIFQIVKTSMNASEVLTIYRELGDWDVELRSINIVLQGLYNDKQLNKMMPIRKERPRFIAVP